MHICRRFISRITNRLVFGSLWFALLHSSGNKSLLFFDEALHGLQCVWPSRQTFKCAVYKNGELVKNHKSYFGRDLYFLIKAHIRVTELFF